MLVNKGENYGTIINTSWADRGFFKTGTDNFYLPPGGCLGFGAPLTALSGYVVENSNQLTFLNSGADLNLYCAITGYQV
jgi:hypothetical protein